MPVDEAADRDAGAGPDVAQEVVVDVDASSATRVALLSLDYDARGELVFCGIAPVIRLRSAV